MHDKRSEQLGKKDPASDQLPPAIKVKPEAKNYIMPPAAAAAAAAANGRLQSTHGAPAAAAGGAKSAPLRHCKSFNSKESMAFKGPKSHESSKISNNSTEAAALVLTAESNGGNFPKSNGFVGKSQDALWKPKQNGSHVKGESVQPYVGRSEKVKSPAGVLKNSSSYKLAIIDHNDQESQRKNSKAEASPPKPSYMLSSEGDCKSVSSRVIPCKVKEASPALAQVKSLSLSLNADPHKKLPPIKTTRTSPASAKSASAKNLANLCAECRAELQGAVCFIGNDGRVSACTSRNAVRLCKNLKCANNNPEFVASMAAAVTAPKKYLVSRRHSLNLPRSTLPNVGKPGKAAVPDKADAQTPTQNGSASEISGDLAAMLPPQQEEVQHESDEFEEDVTSPDDLIEEVGEIDGIASASPHGGRLNGYQRVRRRSISVMETRPPSETVTLRKQMLQERKQAEEWMLDYAIDEALQKLGPSKDSKVKALVEAFESVIIPHKEVGEAVAQDHQQEQPKTPSKIAVKA